MQVKIAIFHNMGAGSDLLPLAISGGRRQDRESARDYLPGDPIARVFDGYAEVSQQRSAGIWIDGYHPTADSHGQPVDSLQLDGADIQFILGWVFAMTRTTVQAMIGAQREAGLIYHGRNLRPLTYGDVVAVGEVPFVLDGLCTWQQLTSPFREVRWEGGQSPQS